MNQSDDRNEIIRRRMEDRVDRDRAKNKKRKKNQIPSQNEESNSTPTDATKEAVRSLSFEPSPEHQSPEKQEVEKQEPEETEQPPAPVPSQPSDEVDDALLAAMEDDFDPVAPQPTVTPPKVPKQEKKPEVVAPVAQQPPAQAAAPVQAAVQAAPKPETPKQIYNPKRRWMPAATTVTTPAKVETPKPEPKESPKQDKPQAESMREFSDDEAIDNRLKIVEEPPEAPTTAQPTRTSIVKACVRIMDSNQCTLFHRL